MSYFRAVEIAAKLQVYRGESSTNRDGVFWSTDFEFARQFTQSGRESEVKSGKISLANIYAKQPLPYAGNEKEIDAAIAAARMNGFIAVRCSEGIDQPDSIFVLKKQAIEQAAKSLPLRVSFSTDVAADIRRGMSLSDALHEYAARFRHTSHRTLDVLHDLQTLGIIDAKMNVVCKVEKASRQRTGSEKLARQTLRAAQKQWAVEDEAALVLTQAKERFDTFIRRIDNPPNFRASVSLRHMVEDDAIGNANDSIAEQGFVYNSVAYWNTAYESAILIADDWRSYYPECIR